jgi:regulator of sigma E protease
MIVQTLKFLFICVEVVVLFNLMIIVHEIGHFLAARWRGLVIEKFGIWFGKPIWEKKIGGVIYSLGSIPAGGFVALPQLAPMEVLEGEVETDRSQLPPVSALDKIIVAFAGPLFSFSLAAIFAVLVWQVGRPVSEGEATTVVGYVAPDSNTAKAGVLPGDRLLKVDGGAVTRWVSMGGDSVQWRVVRSEGETVELEVERKVDGQLRQLTILAKPSVPETKIWNRKGLRQLSIQPAEAPVVGEVAKDSPAAKAGLQVGDAIVGANGAPLYHLLQLSDLVSKHPGEPVQLAIERDGQRLETQPMTVNAVVVREVVHGLPAEAAGLKIGDRVVAVEGTPVTSANNLSKVIRSGEIRPVALSVLRDGKPAELKVTPTPVEGEERPMIGVSWEDDFGMIFNARGRTALLFPGPIDQLRKAAMSIVETVGAVASRKSDVKLQHMGGPLMMMRAYYGFFQLDFADGWRLAFWFSVVLNMNLAMLNLLPIPVLDGGHIVLALIEGIRRRPVSVRILEFVQSGCAVMIIGFMAYIFFFDVQDLFQRGPKPGRSKVLPAEAVK